MKFENVALGLAGVCFAAGCVHGIITDRQQYDHSMTEIFSQRKTGDCITPLREGLARISPDILHEEDWHYTGKGGKGSMRGDGPTLLETGYLRVWSTIGTYLHENNLSLVEFIPGDQKSPAGGLIVTKHGSNSKTGNSPAMFPMLTNTPGFVQVGDGLYRFTGIYDEYSPPFSLSDFKREREAWNTIYRFLELNGLTLKLLIPDNEEEKMAGGVLVTEPT